VNGKRHIFLLIGTLAAVSLTAVGVTIAILYDAAVDQHRSLLRDIVQSQARSIEATVEHETAFSLGRTDLNAPDSAVEAALQQVRLGLSHMAAAKRSFEITVGRRDIDQIVFLVKKPDPGFEEPLALPISSDLAQPMRLALSGGSGSVVGIDYHRVPVLAAYEYMPGLNMGLVAKVDMAEIRAPYIRAGLIALIAAVVLILAGTVLFSKVGMVLIRTLHESEERLRTALQAAEVVAWEIDPATGTHHESGPVESVYGPLRGNRHPHISSLIDRIHVDDRDRVMSAVQSALSGAGPYDVEYRVPQEDGGTRRIAAHGMLMPGGDGRASRLLGIARDVTERKKAEEVLRAKSEELERYFTSSLDLLCIADVDGYFLRLNPEWEKVLGYTIAELEGRRFLDLVHPDDMNDTRKALSRLENKEEILSFENRYRCKDGSYRWIEWRSRPVDGLIYAAARDITRRKDMAAALRASEERLSRIVGAAQDAIVMIDPCGSISMWNDSATRIFGYSESEVLGRNLHQLLAPNRFLEDHLRAFAGFVNGGEGRSIGRVAEMVAKHKSGAEFPIELSLASAHLGGGWHAIGVVRDITERKRVEEALRRFKIIFDTANFGAAIADLNGLLTYVNDCYAASHGYEPSELLGQPLVMLHSSEQSQQMTRLVRQLIVNGSLPAEEVAHSRRDGSTFPMLMTGMLVKDADGSPQCVAFTAIDLSERKALEDQLRQAQKMESVGRLAGGVAHDFNNMLVVILGHVEAAFEHLDPTSPLHAVLQEIRRAAERSADLTRGLLAFARKQTVAPITLDINDGVEKMIRMLERLIGEDIRLNWRPGDRVWPVRMDPSQIDQILANLCVNAKDAIADIGTITIRTRNRVFDADHCANHPGFECGEYVRLDVSDDGCGMDHDTLSHIFEPFFTTKDQGKGTGLGLATVYGIVRQNNGFIKVRSKKGVGTTLSIYLPRHIGAVEPMRASENPGADGRGHETVLVVEDEPAILQLTTAIIRKRGYTVLVAPTPNEAIRLSEAFDGEIHLLITDVIMPQMNGLDLAEDLKSRRPGLKCIFMSGYTADIIAHRGILDEGVNFVQKPFSAKVMSAMIREVLDQGKDICALATQS
jgi:two-component system cell cycle sensor histidine kinase/response regulator CckA